MTCDFDRNSHGSCADRYRHIGRDQQGNVATCTSNKTLGIFRLASSGKRSSRPIRSPKHMEGQSHLRPVILHHLLIKTNIVLPANLLKRRRIRASSTQTLENSASKFVESAATLSRESAQWSEFRDCKAQCLRKRKYIEKEHLLDKVLQKAIEIRILWMHLKSLAILFTHVNRLDVLLDTVPNSTKILRRDSQFNTRPDACKMKESGRKCLPFFTSL